MNQATRVRFAILTIAIAIALSIFIQCQLVDQNTNLLVTSNALAAISFLYACLLVTPIITFIPQIVIKPQLIAARRAFGVAAAMFATIHTCYAFFSLLGGFAGLKYLTSSYILGISLSAVACLILLLLAATSFDWAMRWLGRKWKYLHQFVYVAAILIVIHALILGPDFVDPASAIYRTWYVLVVILFALEAARLDRYLALKIPGLQRLGVMLVVVATLFGYTLASFNTVTGGGLSVHAGHIALAQQAQVQASLPVPGVVGDPSKRYSVGFTHPDTIAVNQSIPLSFHISNASTGETVTQYVKFYDKFVHMLVTDEQLDYFDHVHPTFDGENFTINYTFPHEGRYHIYLDFQPYGGIEQTFAQDVVVGTNPGSIDPAVLTPTTAPVTVDGYTATLKQQTFLASEMSVGKQLISFTITKNGQPVTTLEPYLAAYGHLTLINTDTYEFLHVHPNILVSNPPVPIGPTIDFLPLGLNGPIKPGTYRGFAELNPDDHYIVIPFTIVIQ